MTVTLWTTFALVLWIVLWALGSKGWDAFMLATLIIVIGATLQTLKKYLPGSR
jgi:hypothetical protein